MAKERPYDKVRPINGDTGSLGFNLLAGASRSTFSGTMAMVEAARPIPGHAASWKMTPRV